MVAQASAGSTVYLWLNYRAGAWDSKKMFRFERHRLQAEGRGGEGKREQGEEDSNRGRADRRLIIRN